MRISILQRDATQRARIRHAGLQESQQQTFDLAHAQAQPLGSTSEPDISIWDPQIKLR